MKLEEVSTQLLYSVAPVFAQEENGVIFLGTGFVISIDQKDGSSIPLLITNRHLLDGKEICYAEMHVSKNGIPSDQTANVRFDKKVIEVSTLGDLDLVALPFASALNELLDKNIKVFYKGIGMNLFPNEEVINSLAAIESVIFIGYPSNAYDNINKLPISRRGITATPIWNNYKGEETFLIDANVFPGSSGGPVIVYDRMIHPTKDGFAFGGRIFLAGVLTEALTDNEKEFVGLGKVINSTALYRELSHFLKRLTGKRIEEM